MRKLVLGFAMLLLFASSVFGQGAGQIVGSVHDPSQGVVPNAKITVTETGTGQSLMTPSGIVALSVAKF